MGGGSKKPIFAIRKTYSIAKGDQEDIVIALSNFAH